MQSQEANDRQHARQSRCSPNKVGVQIIHDQSGTHRTNGNRYDPTSHQAQGLHEFFQIERLLFLRVRCFLYGPESQFGVKAVDLNMRECIQQALRLFEVRAASGIREDGNATGDLDILCSLTISGAGADQSIIDGNQLDRVLHIQGVVTVEITGLQIRRDHL